MPKNLIIILFVFLISCKNNTTPLFTNPNLAFIVNGGHNSISVLNITKKKIVQTIKLDLDTSIFAYHINFSTHQKYLSIALPHYDFSVGHKKIHGLKPVGGIGILDAENLKLLKKIPVEEANFNAIVNENRNEVYTASFSHSAKIYTFRLDSAQLIAKSPMDPDPADIVITNKYMLAAGEESSFLSVFDLQTKKMLHQIKVDPYPTNIKVGFDENSIFVENSNMKSLNIVDLNSLKVIDNIDLDFPTGYAEYNRDNAEIWVCSPTTNRIAIYKKNAGKWAKINTINTDLEPISIGFYKNYGIVINQKAGTCQMFDTRNYKLIKTLKTGLKPNGIAIRK